jgi:hypothetical protein
MKKLSVLGVAVAALGLTASSAAAGEVTYWTCHGPGNEPLGFDLGGFDTVGDGCATQTANLGSGLRLSLPMNDGKITYGPRSASVSVPAGTKLQQVIMNRRVTGVAPDVKYSAMAGSALIDSRAGADVPAGNVSAAVPANANASTVRYTLDCTKNPCPATTSTHLDIGRIGLKVSDTSKPSAGVGGYHSPAAGELKLNFAANDSGSGLRYADAWVTGPANGGLVRKAFTATGACGDFTGGEASIDMSIDAACPHTDNVEVVVPLSSLPDGPGYTLNYRVVDWAGNEWTSSQPLEVLNKPNLGSPTATLQIGTTGSTPLPSPGRGGSGGSGGVAGAGSQNCTTPRLSFSLAQKPVRIRKGVPVLHYKKRYRFTGRLTCVINGKRRSAPKRVRVDIFNKLHKKTYEKSGITTNSKGRLRVILAYPSSRTIIFRFTNSDGKRSQVSIKVRVEKKKHKKSSKRR